MYSHCLALLIALLPAVTMAQKSVDQVIESIKTGQIDSPAQRTADLDAVMKQHLGLSDPQMSKVHQINWKYSLRTDREIIAQPDLGTWSKYKLLMTLQEEKDAELKQVLTTDQFKKYTSARDDAFWKAVRAIIF